MKVWRFECMEGKMFGKNKTPKVDPLIQERERLLDEIAGVVKLKWILPSKRSRWYVLAEKLQASKVELDKLAAKPSWERLMHMHFFDDEDTYCQPLLLTRPSEPSECEISKSLVFATVDDCLASVGIWLYYYHPFTVTELGAIKFTVEGISESEAMALELKNSAIIKQVDAILANTKVKTM